MPRSGGVNTVCTGDDCPGDGGGGSGGGDPVGGNAYEHSRMYKFAVNEDHDWPWGSMEIEIFGDVGGHYAGCVRYTGIATSTYYTVDTLDYRNTAASAVADSTTPFHLYAAEDDDEGCVFHSSHDDPLGDLYIGLPGSGLAGYGAVYFNYTDLGILHGIGVSVIRAAP